MYANVFSSCWLVHKKHNHTSVLMIKDQKVARSAVFLFFFIDEVKKCRDVGDITAIQGDIHS